MPEYRYDIEQNTDEWYFVKTGMIGASDASAVLMSDTTKGYNALVSRIIEERVTHNPSESKSWNGNYYTQRGHEYEPIAREDFSMRNLINVNTVGVVIMDEWVLCSPDGLIYDDGLCQIKCPIFNTHRNYLKIIDKNSALHSNDLLNKIDSSYYKQCQFELMVTGRSYNYWTSFHPNLPAIDIKISRDDALIELFKSSLNKIILEVKQEIEFLTKK